MACFMLKLIWFIGLLNCTIAQSIEVIDGGNLVFINNGSTRIGYKYGNNETVYFDSLSSTDQQLGLQLQQMWFLGKFSALPSALIIYKKGNEKN